MDNQASDLLEKIRQQYDSAPFPRVSLDTSPKVDANLLYIHNLVTPYYLRNQKVIDTVGKVILDAGCGTGYKSLVLAEANPGAKIIGIDISEASVNLARQRLEYHGFNNAEFYVLPIEELPNIGLEFDYINCDELLYFFPDTAVALQAMKSVLKAEGMIRSNLHSAIQRFNYFRAQKVFKMMGLMDGGPGDMEAEIVADTMKALKDQVNLKAFTWKPPYDKEDGKERILMNFLLQGDKGYTITDMFAALRAANLEFISMVNWREWELMDLFKEPENLPVFLAMSLPEISVEERLQLCELLHPQHRLLDFWCGHPNQAKSFVPISEWTQSDWQEARVHLHPQVRRPELKAELIRCVSNLNPFQISQGLRLQPEGVFVDSTIAACLLPLWDEAQPMKSLVQRWQQIRPVNPATLEPITAQEAWELLIQVLTWQESVGYVLVESNV